MLKYIDEMKNINLIITLLMTFTLSSCNDFFNVEDRNLLPEDEHYKNLTDVVPAISGLYALMQELADLYWLVGETRGDLVVPGRGANKDLYDVCMNQATSYNPYSDFTPFYSLINNCNGVIEGLSCLRDVNQDYTQEMLEADLLEVKFIRGWTWYQLARIWGDVPYSEKYISSASDIETNEPVLVNTLIRKLVDELYPLASPMNPPESGNGINFNRSRFNYYSMRILLAEMCLEIEEYTKAYGLLNPFFPIALNPQARFLRMGYHYHGATWGDMFAGSEYASFKDGGTVQIIAFRPDAGVKNNMIRWTDNKNKGILAFKPSRQAILNWESQPQAEEFLINYTIVQNGKFGDQWRGNLRSYYIDGNDTIIYKYLIKNRALNEYTLGDDIRKDISDREGACFPLWRDSHVCLLYTEILNRLGRTYEALQLVMGGATRGIIGSYPDNRSGIGIRGRIWLYPLHIDPNTLSPAKMDSLIMNEWGLETAFEGTRFLNMLRMARHSNNYEMMAERIAGKYPEPYQAKVKAFFTDPENWYMPYPERALSCNPKLKRRTGINLR